MTPSAGTGYAKGYVTVARVEKLEKLFQDLKNEAIEKKISDNIMHAKWREEHDTELNGKRQDRITITGMTARRSAPDSSRKEEWKTWFRQEVIEALVWMDSEIITKIIFVNHLGKQNNKIVTGGEIPPAEVRFQTKEIADKIRKLFVEGRRAGKVTGKLYITNSVTLATRVRADVMWAMANQFATSRGQVYVSTYDIAPKLHIKLAGFHRDSFSLTFGESLLRYGKDLKSEYLDAAYRRAGNSFGRLLEEHFVVMHDKMRPAFPKKPENRGNGAPKSAPRSASSPSRTAGKKRKVSGSLTKKHDSAKKVKFDKKTKGGKKERKVETKKREKRRKSRVHKRNKEKYLCV